jgi:hypothetical protein
VGAGDLALAALAGALVLLWCLAVSFLTWGLAGVDAAGAATAATGAAVLAGSAANAETAIRVTMVVIIDFMIFPFRLNAQLSSVHIYNAAAHRAVDKISKK